MTEVVFEVMTGDRYSVGFTIFAESFYFAYGSHNITTGESVFCKE